MKNLAPLLALLLAACSAEPISDAPSALLVDVDPPPYCEGPPYSQLLAPRIISWVSPLCKGEVARGEWSWGYDANGYQTTPRHCLQTTTGEVFCVDLASPVREIYFRNYAHSNACEQWVLTEEPWYVWRSCGVQPVAPPSGDEI